MFIEYNLGSLIIKQVGVILARIPFILNSSQALVLTDYNNILRDIRLFTVGIIFFETSYHGSEVAVYNVWLVQIMGHDKMLLESFKRNSPAFYEITRNFETSYNNVDIVCFYEDKDALYGF